ncbi:TPA: cation transporter [bacterium]|nr:cation transporter [bacterium]
MDKYKKISFVLILVLVANIIVAATKIVLGYLLKLNSLTADGFHAISDSTSNVIGLIGVKLASKPADEKHPYGHQKFETIASMIIGFMLILISFNIIYNAIIWFINPITPSIDFSSLITIIITLFFNIFVAIYEYKMGKKLNSEVLISDSIHTRSDFFISLGVIITIVLINAGVSPTIDPVLSLIIALLVLYSAYKILKTSFSILIDEKAINQEDIKKVILNTYNDVIDVHKIKSRGHIEYTFIEMHIVLPSSKNVTEIHNLIHEIHELLEIEFNRKIELNVHIEPGEINRY